MALLAIIINISINTVSVLYTNRSDLLGKEQKKYSGFKNYNQSSSSNNLPDIYYIVLDSYPNQECMGDVFGFGNEDFIKYLRGRGFFITKNNRSNYNFTKFSISTTFNLDYLPMEKIHNDIFKLKKNDIFFKRIRNSQLVSYLELLGYSKYLDSPIMGNEYLCIEFNVNLLYMTVLASPYISNYVSALLFRDYVLLNLKSWEKHINVKKPMFVYEHIIIPHVPYMFDRYGNMPHIFKSNVQELFIEQLLYTNTHAKRIIDNILSNYKINRPIIIIQGDHGPDIIIKDKEKRMKIRTSILNAIYLPDEKENIFYDGMTSVNTFRIIFNKYFGTDFEILPDITYYQDNERSRLVRFNPN